MKKILLCLCVLVSVSLSQTALASIDYQSTKDKISKTCSSRISEDKFHKGSSCTGFNSEVFYVGDKEVTQVEFEKQKKVYDDKGDICTETKKSKKGERPQELSYSCKKGEYAQYKINGKKVTFAKFRGALIFTALTTVDESVTKETIDYLNKEKRLLKTINTFKEALKSSNNHSFSFPVIGSPCVGNGGVTINGTGYKNSICENRKIKSLEYYQNDKLVNSETYIKDAYKKSKEVNKLQLENLKKQK